MRRSFIFVALIMTFAFVTISKGQTTGVFRLTFSGQTTPDGSRVSYVTFTGLENPNVRLMEAIVAQGGECSAASDVSNAHFIGPDRATVVYDFATGTYKVWWKTPPPETDGCRILLADGDVDGRDFLLWQRSFGQSSLVDEDKLTKTSDLLTGTQSEANATIRVHYNTGWGNRIL